MRYAIVNDAGAVEVRQDSGAALPDGAIELTDERFDSMIAGTLTAVDGQLVAAEPPQVVRDGKGGGGGGGVSISASVSDFDALLAVLIGKGIITQDEFKAAKG